MSRNTLGPYDPEKVLFASYLNKILATQGEELPHQLSLLAVEKNLMEIIGSALIYIINDYSQNGRLRGDTPEERYRFFNFDQATLDNAFEDLKTLFPFADKRLRCRLVALSKTANDVLKFFDNDYDKLLSRGIIPAGARVNKIIPCGDFHNSRCTYYLSFLEGGGVYLKWRTSDNEKLISKLIEVLEESNLSFYPKALDRDGYTWVKEVSREPLESELQAGECFRNIGKLACITYLLGITDLHHENVIPVRTSLVVVDCETTMTINTRPPQDVSDATRIIGAEIINSVLGSALFPVGSGGELYGGDISALGSGKYVTEQRVLINTFRDDIRYKRKIVQTIDTKHLPFLLVDGVEKSLDPVKYKNEIISGFRVFYKKALRNQNKLIKLVSKTRLQARILYRRTADYNAIITFTSSPRFREYYPKKIRQLLESVPGIPVSILDSEEKSLLNGDIPFFQIDTLTGDIYEGGFKKVENLPETPSNIYQHRIEELSHEDMEEQVQIIDFSFVGDNLRLDSGRKKPLYQPSDRTTVDDAAIALFESYFDSAVISEKDGSINWLTVHVDDRDRLELSPLPADIYGGLSGVGLAFLSYYSAFKDRRALNLIQGIINSCEIEIKNPLSRLYISPISYYTGLFGVINFLSKAKNIPEIKISFNIDHIFRRVIDKENSFESEMDIISGLAGTLLSLKKEADSNLFSKERLLLMGDQLVHLVTKLWPDGSQKCASNASFAHGPCGIASALLNLFILTGEDRFLHVWSVARKKENDFRDSSGKSWMDTRKKDGTFSPHWCHGLTGILLTRNHWLQTDREFSFLSPETKREIYTEAQIAQQGIEMTGLRMDSLSLCHGVTGNLSALQIVSPNRDLRKEWESLAWYGLNKGWLCGLSTQFESMSAMTGLAGILQAFSLVKLEDFTATDLLWPNVDFGGSWS